MIRENNIFIVGIKGVAMANLAVILKNMGKDVTGSDIEEEFITDKLLLKNNISYTVGFEPESLSRKTDLIIYSAAHGGITNPQVVEAKKRDILALSQTELLDQIMERFKKKIAVCGCHGKTTTASLLAYSLIKLGVKPSYLIGSPSFDGCYGSNYHTTVRSSYFVVEADEYGVDPPRNKTPKFHFLKPDYIICTNIDFDHPDVYKDTGQVKEAFLKFFGERKLFLCADDLQTLQLINRLKHNQYQTFGFSEQADLQIENPTFIEPNSSFVLYYKGKYLGKFRISLPGNKNISNAAGVILTLLNLGFPVEKIRKAIAGFSGSKRRFEKIAHINNIYLFDDYAHHPAEIKATIGAARTRFPKRRVIVIFQPHTYSRIQALLYDFVKSLSLADCVLILPIFASAREKKGQFKISSLDIVNCQKKDNLFALKDNAQLIKRLNKILQKGDVIFTMGAGDVYKLKDDIINIIKHVA